MRLHASSNDAALSKAWHRTVVNRRARCVVCGATRRLQGHHVIAQAVLRRYAVEHDLSIEETQALFWDPRNAVALDEVCHQRHTNAYRRVPRYVLPAHVFEFVRDLDARYDDGRQPIRARLEAEYPF